MNTKLKQGESSPPPPQADHNPLLIQQALEEIFQSTPFRTTKQCQDLLRYVVENSLAGLDQLLRERVIGAEVFGRKRDYDTGEDPVVRLRASEVRKRLAQYYQGAKGGVPVRIDIPPGSYRATFEWLTPTETSIPLAAVEREQQPSAATLVAVSAAHEPAIVDARAEPERVPVPRWAWAGAVVILLIAAAGLLVHLSRNTADSAFKEFWSPMVASQRPVLICMGTNAVYRLSNDFLARYMKENHLENHGMEFFADLPPDSHIEVRDLKRAYNSFVALGDVAAVSDVVATLTRQGKVFQQRFPPDISFAELQQTPTVTIGGFNNNLTMTLTKDLRYVLQQGSQVEDQQTKKVWIVKYNTDSHDAEDYAIVSRLTDSKSGGPVISIAGVGQYGTQASAEFISNPQMVANLMNAAPKGWNRRNLQVVLHIKIVNYRPVSTEVVAANYW